MGDNEYQDMVLRWEVFVCFVLAFWSGGCEEEGDNEY